MVASCNTFTVTKIINSQAFIHPSLARFFWSTSSTDHRGITWSPYAYCNGTFTNTRNHEFSFREFAPGSYIFIDFSGSGIVHLCGMFYSTVSLL